MTQLAPPFYGFRMIRSNPPSTVAWTAARFTPSSGQVVFQMGAVGEMEQPEGVVGSAGYEGDFTPSANGMYAFTLVFALGPVSLLPRGGYEADGMVFLTLGGPNVSASTELDLSATTSHGFTGRYYGVESLTVGATLAAGTTYKIRATNGVRLDYPGIPNPAPYGEVIATYQQLKATLMTATRAAEPKIVQLLSRAKYESQEISAREMAEKGTL